MIDAERSVEGPCIERPADLSGLSSAQPHPCTRQAPQFNPCQMISPAPPGSFTLLLARMILRILMYCLMLDLYTLLLYTITILIP